MAVTIKDVAKETGLAISTISKYLNGGTVREKNRIIIEEAVQKLGYFPNSTARALRTSKSYMIGLLAGNIDTPHTAAQISEIEKKMHSLNYSLIFASHQDRAEQAGEYVKYMVEQGVDGIIAIPTEGYPDYLETAGQAGIPVVIMEERSHNIEADCVQVDCAAGTYQLIEYLIGEGHRKIAVIVGPQNRLTAQERLRGYLRVLEDYECEIDSEYMIQGDFTYKSGYEGICRLWALEERPTAVFVSDYTMCLGAMAAIHSLGIRVPEELSIVSFDDFELSVMVKPKLTTIRQPLAELADTACGLLCKRMKNDYNGFPEKIRLKPEFILRDSVKSLKRSEERKS